MTYILLLFSCLHSPWLATVIVWLLSHASDRRTHSLGYVWPSDPHTGMYSLVHKNGRQTHAAPRGDLRQWCNGWLQLDFSQGSGSMKKMKEVIWSYDLGCPSCYGVSRFQSHDATRSNATPALIGTPLHRLLQPHRIVPLKVCHHTGRGFWEQVSDDQATAFQFSLQHTKR